MDLNVVSLFPEMIRDAAAWGVTGRALENGAVRLECTNPRDFTGDVHQTVDDRPYGGGPGMVLKYEPVSAAIASAREQMPEGSKVVFLSPQGRKFNQEVATELAATPGIVLVCGRYEGFDERLIEAHADDELSLGDYVISGGELGALVVMDAVMRLLPGVLGDEASAEQDSFSEGLLDCPHYTRPEVVAGRQVPAVLLNGNHAEIRRWRLQQALGRTLARRPELIEGRELTAEEQQLLQEYNAAHSGAAKE
ncbi:MAG: tRNA (guanosine(37)-N1)-methyltransferase TrmD [Gammaproteobacteria bacterium]|nr:tRNA (guanosine(37)-N1)-methyltransferase TrmD [Gammaproteobacteria bacterium]NND53583.1 tRNA (guanosine(37)-N1)-methyltransferase TrmD [Gammaproteobacteria bacterium]